MTAFHTIAIPHDDILQCHQRWITSEIVPIKETIEDKIVHIGGSYA